jgi:magnesium transporter
MCDVAACQRVNVLAVRVRTMAEREIRSLVDEECIAVTGTTTVGETIETIRERRSEEVTIYYVYVLDEDGTLVGVVSLRELLNEADGTPLSEVRSTDPVSVEATEPVTAAAKTFVRYGFAALPVVDSEGAFEGIVRSSEVIDVLDERTAKELIWESKRFVPFGD